MTKYGQFYNRKQYLLFSNWTRFSWYAMFLRIWIWWSPDTTPNCRRYLINIPLWELSLLLIGSVCRGLTTKLMMLLRLGGELRVNGAILNLHRIQVFSQRRKTMQYTWWTKLAVIITPIISSKTVLIRENCLMLQSPCCVTPTLHRFPVLTLFILPMILEISLHRRLRI